MLIGGISNPLEVIEQITYLLFLKRLDDLHTLEQNKSTRLKKPMERRVFPEGKDPKKRAYEDCRWSRFKHFEAKEMFEVVDQHVFPFLRTLGGDDSTYALPMKDARFTIPTPVLLAKVVDMIDGVPMEDRDTCNTHHHRAPLGRTDLFLGLDPARWAGLRHRGPLAQIPGTNAAPARSFATLQHHAFRGDL